MNVLKIDKCPLCGNNRFEKALECTDHYATGESFCICRCRQCGFLFTQGVPTEAEIGRYYESPDYISHSDTNRGWTNRVYHWVRRFMLKRKVHLVKQSSGLSQGTLLDIGTGTGYFPHALQQAGWKVTAIEKSPKARAFAAEHFQLDVLPPEALSSLPDASFDAITLWHVLEHLEALNETWQQLYRLLKPNGVLVIAVPNPSSYDAAYYGERWAAYDVPRHLWHFAPAILQQFGVKHGFIMAERHPMPFDACYISMMTERYYQKSLPFLRGLWVGAKAWMATLGKKERSSSMIYIFRKKELSTTL